MSVDNVGDHNASIDDCVSDHGASINDKVVNESIDENSVGAQIDTTSKNVIPRCSTHVCKPVLR